MSHFVPGSAHELDAILRPHVADFGRKVEARARVKYRQRLGKNDEATGATERSIRLDFGPSGLSLTVSANNFDNGVNVGYVGHQGHKRIKKKNFMKFTVNGSFVTTNEVRAVGGWPFLRDALREVAREEGWKYVANGPRPVRAPLPHVRVAKVRRGR